MPAKFIFSLWNRQGFEGIREPNAENSTLITKKDDVIDEYEHDKQIYFL